MANILLPDDPDFTEPLKMGDAYKQALTPKMASKRNAVEHDANDNFKYAASLTAHAPDAWVKGAQQTGVSNMMTDPMWFSPLHTPQNWQIASKRREVYQWCHHPDTDILMGNGGLKPIKEVRIGDYVISHLGKKRKVRCVGKRLIDENVYTIYYSGMNKPLITTGNHKIFSASRNNIEVA